MSQRNIFLVSSLVQSARGILKHGAGYEASKAQAETGLSVAWGED